MNILVTGGAGYIGSVCAQELIDQGHEVTIIDNFSTGHRGAIPTGAYLLEADIEDIFELPGKFDAVFHFAANALVGESINDPAGYYQNNLVASKYLIDLCRAAGITRFIFSSTAAVYGQAFNIPIQETSPTYPINPYGESKLAFERMLEWYSRAYGIDVTVFRYFNAAGATKTHGESRLIETHIIPLLLNVAAGERESFTIHGTDYPTKDGTCIRDFVHVKDIVSAHILALNESKGFSVYNIGSGQGYSVLEVLSRVGSLTRKVIRWEPGERRQGDPAVLLADPSKLIAELGWQPKYSSLDNIIQTAWDWKQRSK
jgi:UDP-glucose 4-epimerase